MLSKANKPTKPKCFVKAVLSSAIQASIVIQPAFAEETYIDIFDYQTENALNFEDETGKYGQVKFNLRYRFEMADVADNGRETAYANTLRLRFGYLTPEFYGLQAYGEFEGNVAMQRDYFSPKSDWKGDLGREVIADPQSAELNQMYVTYKGIPDTELKAGRQRINIDDQRFIGAVAWRQMEQTFDSGLITNKSIKNLTMKVGYIGQVQNIWSELDTVQFPFLNVNYKFKGLANISAYGLWLADFDTGQAGRSAQTYGILVNGSPKITKSVKLHYHAEYSYQADYKNNPNSVSLSRYSLMGGASYMGITLKGAVEELGASGGQAFQTPFGTNHKFQGWADKFLVTPKDGVRDINATLAAKPFGVKMAFVYHNFQSVTNSIDYGNEYDFLVTKKFGKHYQLLAKYAYYDAYAVNGNAAYNSALSQNTHKFWLQGSVFF
ncbi:hypothetical protein BPLS_P6096 [Bathymodiolus platifrons methanotrophic gill symbiont]|uniref:alginate export family protein n=1 Tax=Bathymodiolus platifrons methanotrophic gill symbiont TaxID=113268 RepID=UPI0011C6F3A7|nr:alginate export family protein [Bathymodiolus platifrons methanotrophic gill symbiont]TXK95919.1 hypothetical protein BMR02_12165 [Methylococcaceae bacterium HT1]TXL17620.1 hypothetical protein BMR04_05025 [Methylococcaceae bacterium HT3]TXL22225.1 hypothetical protein BMR03_09395 [Methylococcaceae bacterium HT2]GFO77575.1 hypothetical protein BPLS_P6096 [Bathymodiolus platifrons methanotrophic gill symbiont]